MTIHRTPPTKLCGGAPKQPEFRMAALLRLKGFGVKVKDRELRKNRSEISHVNTL